MLTIDPKTSNDLSWAIVKDFDVTVKTQDGVPLNVVSAELVGDVIEVTLEGTHQNIADGYKIWEAIKNNPNECTFKVGTEALSEEA